MRLRFSSCMGCRNAWCSLTIGYRQGRREAGWQSTSNAVVPPPSTQIREDQDKAFAAGRNADGFRFRRDFPDAARGERSMLWQEYRAGTAVRRVERAPRALQGHLSVRRDRTGVPVLRLEDVGKGWRAAPETSYRELMERKLPALIKQRKAARAAQKTRQTAPARERARERADAAQAQIAPLRRAINRRRDA